MQKKKSQTYENGYRTKICDLTVQVKKKMQKREPPNKGLEPLTLRLKVWCSTDWANRAAALVNGGVFVKSKSYSSLWFCTQSSFLPMSLKETNSESESWLLVWSYNIYYFLLFYLFYQFPYTRDIRWFTAKCLACLALREFRYRLKWPQVRASATNVSFFFFWKFISSLPRLRWRAWETSCQGRFLGKLWNELGNRYKKSRFKISWIWKQALASTTTTTTHFPPLWQIKWLYFQNNKKKIFNRLRPPLFTIATSKLTCFWATHFGSFHPKASQNSTVFDNSKIMN